MILLLSYRYSLSIITIFGNMFIQSLFHWFFFFNVTTLSLSHMYCILTIATCELYNFVNNPKWYKFFIDFHYYKYSTLWDDKIMIFLCDVQLINIIPTIKIKSMIVLQCSTYIYIALYFYFSYTKYKYLQHD